jgi:hypothetical protein
MPTSPANDTDLTPELIERVKRLSVKAREELMDILIDCAEPLSAEAEQFARAWTENLAKTATDKDTTVMEPLPVKKTRKSKI